MIETFKPSMGTTMEFGWPAFALLIFAATIAWFWQDSLAARERANTAAMEACARLSLQFLDGTVAFARLKVMRGANSLIAFRRTYVFDYTANSIERRQGFVVMTGRRVDSVGYARGEDTSSAQLVREQPINVAQLPVATNVLSLEEWRSRQQSATEKTAETRQNGTRAVD
jgi:hypothetical protein